MLSQVDLYLLARAVEWQYKLDSYTDSQLVMIMSIFDKAQRDLNRRLSRATITAWSEERTNKLLSEIQILMAATKEAIAGNIADTSAVAGNAAYDAHSAILSFSGAAKNVKTIAMTSVTLKSIIVKTPVGGSLLSEWVNKSFQSNMQGKIKKEIAAGLINGDSYRAIVQRLKESIPGTKRELITLAKTYVASVNSQAMQDVYAANSDIIKSVQWRAAMSNRTCLRCAGLDGHEYPVKDHPPLPLHPSCRCTLLGITDKESLGLSPADLQQAARPYSIREGKILGLGGKGKAIDAGTWRGNYDSWLKSLTPQQQKDFLGPRRLELLQSGNISFGDLVDKKTGRIRTLDELTN
jgi:SPP1 gp7 family putative phage head morphogenesis protein